MTTIADAASASTPPEGWEAIRDGFLAFLVSAGWSLLWVVVTVVLALLLSWIMRRLIGRVVDRIVTGAKSRAAAEDTRAIDMSPLAQVRVVQRTRTLGSILTNIVNVAIVIIAALTIVYILNPGVLASFTLLSAAIGAGLGFGAQNIVKDVLNGIFIVAEDQIGIGDVVDVGLATGVVEYVSVRVTHVRDVNGTLWFVRNGEILRIGNMSQGWARVVIDVGVPVDADLDAVEDAMLMAAKDLVREPKWRTRIIDKPEVWGLESIGGETIVTRLVVRTRPNAKDDVSRALRTRMKKALDELGVPLPQLDSVFLTGADAAQSVRGANPPKTKPQQITPPATPPRLAWRPKKRGRTDGDAPEGSAAP